MTLPLDLMSDGEFGHVVGADGRVHLTVPDDYEDRLASASGQSEVLGIQRLLTLARAGQELHVSWQPGIAKKVVASVAIFPTLAVLLLLQNAEHWEIQADGTQTKLPVDTARRAIARHRLARDLFADCEVVVCADGLGMSLPSDLYNATTRRLRSREDLETLVVEALSGQRLGSPSSNAPLEKVGALGLIVAELFENTDMHARLDLEGKPVSPDSVRGLMLKRISVEVSADKRAPKGGPPRSIECFELSVFDAGLGYYTSYTRNALTPSVTLQDEWKVLHNCLERHYHPELADGRPGHRALGLYEVLRAIQFLRGRIEIRTGRLYAYRTFLDGQIQAQMEPRADLAHLAWPKPKLLDLGKKYVAVPSEHPAVVGTSVRVIVPLN